MVRTLIASLAVSMTSIAMACDTCGCTTPAECTGTKTVANEKDDCAASCTSATKAAVMSVASTSADSCSAPCQAACMTEVKTVAGEAKECDSPCTSGKTAGVSLVSYMPKMGYQVAGECVPCPKTAMAMAKQKNDHVHYVVNEVSFDNKAEAMAAHAKQLDAYMMDLVRIQYAVDGACVACPDKAKEMAASCESKKMQYKVGPATFDSADAAIAASIRAYNAAQKVSMQYAVGTEMTTCSVGAKDMAKKADCSVEYVVNGQRTGCSKTAGYLKTVASVESALKALETATGADA